MPWCAIGTLLLHQLAKKYGVQTVLAGHVHEMLQADLDGIRYISMPSAGGHLRGTHQYEDGWFFGYALVEVSGRDVKIQIKELRPPYGRGRITSLDDWGVSGLATRATRPVLP